MTCGPFGQAPCYGQALQTHVKLDFSEAMISHDTIHLDIDLGERGALILVIKPGIVVDADDVTISWGDIKIRDVTGPYESVILRIKATGRAPSGVVARPPRRTLSPRMRRNPLWTSWPGELTGHSSRAGEERRSACGHGGTGRYSPGRRRRGRLRIHDGTGDSGAPWTITT